jgi:hypothetical protein
VGGGGRVVVACRVVRDEGYGRFGVLSRGELERIFYLDYEDRRLIAGRRRDSNRLGFALQLVTVRYLGMFLPPGSTATTASTCQIWAEVTGRYGIRVLPMMTSESGAQQYG